MPLRIKTEQWRWWVFCAAPYLVCALVGAAAAFLPRAEWLEDWCDERLQELRRVK